MAHIGLVLGAGGILGSAFHAGVLAAVNEATGWNPNDADVVVGTSAGASTGAIIRAGMPAADLFAGATREKLSDEGAELAAKVTVPLDLPRRGPGIRLVPPAAPQLLLPMLLNWPPRPFLAPAALLARGSTSADSIAARVNQLHPDGWPEAPLWVNTVRMRDGKRVVFGRDDVDQTDLGVAVQASASIPGFLAPVRIGSHTYIDGGAWSSTNADLCAGLALDAVIISAPKASVDRPPWPEVVRTWSGLGRTLHRQTLRREVDKLRASGTKVLVFEPDSLQLEHLVGSSMNPERAADVARAAREAAERTLADADLSAFESASQAA